MIRNMSRAKAGAAGESRNALNSAFWRKKKRARWVKLVTAVRMGVVPVSEGGVSW